MLKGLGSTDHPEGKIGNFLKEVSILRDEGSNTLLLKMGCNHRVAQPTTQSLILLDRFRMGFAPTEFYPIGEMMDQSEQEPKFALGKICLKLSEDLSGQQEMQLADPFEKGVTGGTI